jgi:hypothetical protein
MFIRKTTPHVRLVRVLRIPTASARVLLIVFDSSGFSAGKSLMT